MENKNASIKIVKNGPYSVSGKVPLQKQNIIPDKEGIPEKWQDEEKYPEQESYKLCRCGNSKNKPFCDKTHLKISFDGKETADRKKYLDKAEVYEGPDLILYDDLDLCAIARFCERFGTVWNLVKDPKIKNAKDIAVEECKNCPSGRLVVKDKKTGEVIEPGFSPSIGVSEDKSQNVSGPLWVKGKISIESSDGEKYEIRNRVTLCRCGKSKNKPFCDGTHIDIGFSDKKQGS